MIANIGFILLVLGVVCSALAAVLSLLGMWKEKFSFSHEVKLLSAITTVAVSAAFVLVLFLLVSGQFNYEMVYDKTSTHMNAIQKVTAVWGNKSGSLLFWSFLLSICVSIAAFGKWKGDKEPYFHGVMLLLSLFNLFFIALITFQTNPFARLWQMPAGDVVASVFAPSGAAVFNPGEGLGLNPLLKHTAMVIHPPLLYLGFILFFIPFAFALVSLWRRDYSFTWLQNTRGWITLAWVFLSAGILLGCWWAYDILGWGGYWSWDPVEVAGLMPWISALGLLHSMDTYQTSPHMRRWAYRQIIATMLLIIFGIYLSRTGAVSSVHAYSQSSIGPAFMGFFIFLLAISLVSLFARRKELTPKEEPPNFRSRAGLARVLAICTTLLVVICLVGVTLPIISRAISGTATEPAQLYYEWNFAPPLLVIFVITALGFMPRRKGSLTICILAALVLTILTGLLYGKMTFSAFLGLGVVFFQMAAMIQAAVVQGKQHAEDGKPGSFSSARWASLLLHFGFALLALGVIGSRSLESTGTVKLQSGQSTNLGDMQVMKIGTGVAASQEAQVLYGEEYRFQAAGEKEMLLQPHILWYEDTGSTVSSPAIHSTLKGDTYAAILEWDGMAEGETTVLISYYPMMSWLWIGGILMMGAALWYLAAISKKDAA